MSCGENHRTMICFFATSLKVYCLYTNGLVALSDDMRHLCHEVNFASATQYCVAHTLYHSRQFVGADMRMSICKDRCGSTMLAKHIKNLFYWSTLLAASI